MHGPMTDKSRVVCETPTPGKQPTRILKWKYDLTREAVLNVVSRSEDGVEFRGLRDLVAAELSQGTALKTRLRTAATSQNGLTGRDQFRKTSIV